MRRYTQWKEKCEEAFERRRKNTKVSLLGERERERERERVKKICEELSMEIVGAEIGECPTLQIEAFTNAAKI